MRVSRFTDATQQNLTQRFSPFPQEKSRRKRCAWTLMYAFSRESSAFWQIFYFSDSLERSNQPLRFFFDSYKTNKKLQMNEVLFLSSSNVFMLKQTRNVLKLWNPQHTSDIQTKEILFSKRHFLIWILIVSKFLIVISTTKQTYAWIAINTHLRGCFNFLADGANEGQPTDSSLIQDVWCLLSVLPEEKITCIHWEGNSCADHVANLCRQHRMFYF